MSNPIINAQINTPPTETKPVYQSKTMWTGLVIAVLGLVSPNLAAALNADPETLQQLVMSVGGALVMVFRYFTTKPVKDVTPK